MQIGIGLSITGQRAGSAFANWQGDTFGNGFAQRDSDWQDTEGVVLTTTTVNSITAALAYINSTVNASPGGHYRITVTTGGTENATPQINRALDIVAAGGSCVVVGDGAYRLHSSPMNINGVKGLTFENFRFYRPIDRGVLEPASANFTAQVICNDFAAAGSEVYFKDCRFGAFDDDDLHGAALGAIMRVMGTSKAMVKECMGRGFLTFGRVSNSAALHIGQSYFDGKTDDLVDMDAQAGSATLVMDGVVEGVPYDRPISVLKIFGGAGESGTFTVGETVTQNSIARGTVVRVLESGDLSVSDAMTKSGTPVTGKVYIERTTQFIEGFAVVGALSGASSAVVGVGELAAYDGDDWLVGSPYAGLHSDFAQWGVSGENALSRYNVTIRNCVSAGSGLNHASQQGTFAEYNSAGVGYTPHQVCVENFHMMPTGFWGMAITAPNGTYRNISSTWPPLGERMPGALAELVDTRREPTPITGGTKGNLRFSSIPADFTSPASMVFENIIAPGTDYQNATAETRWGNILSFDPADRIIVADVTAASGATAYDTLFGASTYDTDQWVETGPTVPMTDTVYVAMARWLQWVRDNREPAVGWGANNWIDPVTFADVEAVVPPSGPTFADSLVVTDFADADWVPNGFTKTVTSGWMIGPTNRVRADTSVGAFTVATTGTHTGVVDVRITSGGSSETVQVRLWNLASGGVNALPTIVTGTGVTALGGASAAGAIDMGGGVWRFWFQNSLTAGARCILDYPTTAETQTDFTNPSIFDGALTAGEITALV